jgi:hypothetical protein
MRLSLQSARPLPPPFHFQWLKNFSPRTEGLSALWKTLSAFAEN